MWPTSGEIDILAKAVKECVKANTEYRLVVCYCGALYCIRYFYGKRTYSPEKCEGCIKKLKPH